MNMDNKDDAKRKAAMVMAAEEMAGSDMNSTAPSALKVIWKEVYHDKVALIGLIIFVAIILSTFIIAFTLDEGYATRIDFRYRNAAPSSEFILGNDPGGRGIGSMLMLGARNSFIIAFSVTILGGALGIFFGLFSGFYGGTVDNFMMRIADTWAMLPTLMIIIVVVTLIPNYTTFHFIIVMSIFGWVGTARMMRAMALQQRSLDYVSASKTLGTRNLVIMMREVLPNMLPTITTNLTLSLAANMGLETGLTFLGFGLPFGTPSLGGLLSHARAPFTLQYRMWQWMPAALMIFILTLCIYCVFQALSRASDARQRRI
jgi:peptide/nickel transport system permease protein